MVFDILKPKVCTDKESEIKSVGDCTYFPERMAFDFSNQSLSWCNLDDSWFQ